MAGLAAGQLERTEALCAEYVAQRPAHACAPEVPIDIQRRHPEWGRPRLARAQHPVHG